MVGKLSLQMAQHKNSHCIPISFAWQCTESSRLMKARQALALRLPQHARYVERGKKEASEE